jgi:hypothetical protein
LAPSAGIDPSWVEGLYMAAERGLDFGTQIVFSFGPLGFLDFPGAYVVDLGRLAFASSALAHCPSALPCCGPRACPAAGGSSPVLPWASAYS